MRKKQSIRNDDEFVDGFVVGIDDVSLAKGSDVAAKALFYLIVLIAVGKWLCNTTQQETFRNQSSTISQAQQSHPTIQGTDLALGVIQQGASHDCSICLDSMPVGSAVRVLPCRHLFHHDCIVGWFEQAKYSCPLCKFDLRRHVEEQRAAHEENNDTHHDVLQRRWVFWRRRIDLMNRDGPLNVMEDGDLELSISTAAHSTPGELT